MPGRSMAPSTVPKPSTLVVEPILHGPDKLCNFGATVSGVNLNNLSDEDLQSIKDAVYMYRVIVIKGQHNLEPIKHWEVVTRLDPNAAPVHGHGSAQDFKKTGGFISVSAESQEIPNSLKNLN
jgi:xanthine dioxygenase